MNKGKCKIFCKFDVRFIFALASMNYFDSCIIATDLELGEALASELNQAWTVVLRVLGKGVHGGQSSFITLRSLAEVWHGLQGGGKELYAI